MYMYVAYIQLFSVLQKGGGLRCTVCTCMHMEKFLPLYSRDLDTPDRYQNIPIYRVFKRKFIRGSIELFLE